MKLLYFSWIKDKIGKAQENIEIQSNVKTVEDLIVFLQNTNDKYKSVFEKTSDIKVSINMETANFNDVVNDNDEVAFFPPMTGG